MTRRCLSRVSIRSASSASNAVCLATGQLPVIGLVRLSTQEGVTADRHSVLPEYCTQDVARREAGRMPEFITFELKGDMALVQIAAVLADGVRFGKVLADAGYL